MKEERTERELVDKWTTGCDVECRLFLETDDALTLECEMDGKPLARDVDVHYFLLARIADLRKWAPDGVSRS